MEWPDISVEIRQEFFLVRWTGFEAVSAIKSVLATKFPDVNVAVGVQMGREPNDVPLVRVIPLTVMMAGETLKRASAASEQLAPEIAQTVFDISLSCERGSLVALRGRLEACALTLQEFRARPEVLSDLMYEVSDLYGSFVETDHAMLMAADHFARLERENPGGESTFLREGKPEIGRWGIRYSHARSNGELRDRFRLAGHNQIVRNRAIIVFLYALWETRFRAEIGQAVGIATEDVRSNLFGDLRHYRHCIMHNRGILDRECKTLGLVAVGSSIDLASDMDRFFLLVVDELNRLAKAYFSVSTKFRLMVTAPGMIVAQVGPSWSDH